MNRPNHLIRGLLLSFGVAVGLISTAGAAWAQEAPTSAPSDGGATIGEALLVERPAPTRDPATELQANPSPAAAPAQDAPSPTPAAAAASSASASPAPAAVAAPARTVTTRAATAPAASSKPARATEVQGVQIVRSAVPTEGETDVADLAFTGVDNGPLVVLALALLATGWVLLRAARPRCTS